ncbi:HAMP domain-containing sensor histidine kinase [Moritella sp. F3]|uniref:sensor histidine kinase n=1 Tax=Moritella sp. F3 TaxID=2718882 RepID=UPI0018E19694|nr:HAMP domain-containing sensor histidine kinase [Moritella sp. F3]GIC79215.1 two-component sensor histidine kinase [Moritella sp. F1]GIC81097.1 two-component sensor histidine kinase [Moritella sp. F3]
MKLRPSLRLYFLGAMLFLGVSMAITFSALTVNYFVEGMDSVLRGTMVEVADTEGLEVQDGKPMMLLDFHVASRWQDLPKEARENFAVPPTKMFEFNKHVVKDELFSPPNAVHFVMVMKTKQGQLLYIYKSYKGDLHARLSDGPGSQFVWIPVFGLSGIAVFALLLIVVMRRVASPVEALRDWAKSLNAKSLLHAPPEFKYKELNTLAKIIHNSLNTVQDSLDREHEFLRNASHELRTPIAVIRTNVELLNKINTKSPMTVKQQQVVERIERAGFTMTHLTETLLWLSRDESLSLTLERVKLDELIRQTTEDLNYLLRGKSVTVELDTSEWQVELPATACRIVLANLVRNAFQHTDSGVVTIYQHQGQVVVRNVNDDVDSNDNINGVVEQSVGNTDTNSNDLGFGLGVKLTDKLTARFNWYHERLVDSSGHKVTVNFITPNDIKTVQDSV